MQTDPSASPAVLYTRRAFVSSLGTLFALSAATHLERVLADESSITTLRSARSELDRVDALIDSARWDAVRTVLAKEPVNRTKQACNELLTRSDSSMKGAIVGLREDALSGIRLLDTAVYSNVFVGEDRQILGTKVDYDVPRVYLKELKAALDELIEVASQVG